MDSIVGYFLENWPALTLVSVFFIALIVILVRGMLFLSKFKTDQIQAFTTFKTEQIQMFSEFKTEQAQTFSEFKTDQTRVFSEFKTDQARVFSEFKTDQARVFSEFKTDQARVFSEFKTEQAQAINELKMEQTKLSTEVGHIHKLLEKLPCEERRKENQANISQLREEHYKMKVELSGVKNTIEFLRNIIAPFANSQSPLSLTDEGKEHAQGLDAENIIDKNWEKIYKDLEENIAGKSRYDIQQYIIDNFHVKIEDFLEKEDIDNMKEYAFVKGKNVYTFFIIYALIIRDKYFKQKGLL
jgi:Tfp pilus assembly protein PilO